MACGMCRADGGYGGRGFVNFDATGFFRVERYDLAWWFVTPDGLPFYSMGVCSVQPVGDNAPSLGYAPYHRNVLAKHGSEEAWMESARSRLEGWGFNTLGGWSNRGVGLPWFAIMYFGSVWQEGTVDDFFSPEFDRLADETIKNEVKPDDKSLIGYFFNNEMQWETDWRRGKPLFYLYMTFEPDAPGKVAIVEFMKRRYGSVAAMGAVWSPGVAGWEEFASLKEIEPVPGAEDAAREDREDFTLMAARRYFRVATETMRRYDPNHLIAGSRFISWTTPAAVVIAAGEYLDVVSVNHYELGPLGKQTFNNLNASVTPAGGDPSFENYYRLARRPLMVTEFGFRSMDSGLPNTWPPPVLVQPTVPTQAARAKKYARYARGWAKRSYFVGHHWFKFMDEPKEGRFDGENGNYGLVNIEDEPYGKFVDAVSEVNDGVWKLHRESGQAMSLLDATIKRLKPTLDVKREFMAESCDALSSLEMITACKFASLMVEARENGESRLIVSGEDGVVEFAYGEGDRYVKYYSSLKLFAEGLIEELADIADSELPMFGTGVPGFAYRVRRAADGEEKFFVDLM